MRVPRTDRDLAALRGSVPDGVIAYLARVPAGQRADLFSTVAVLDGPADLTARVVVTDGAETVDFGTPLYDEVGAPRVLSTVWDVAAEPEPGWTFLY